MTNFREIVDDRQQKGPKLNLRAILSIDPQYIELLQDCQELIEWIGGEISVTQLSSSTTVDICFTHPETLDAERLLQFLQSLMQIIPPSAIESVDLGFDGTVNGSTALFNAFETFRPKLGVDSNYSHQYAGWKKPLRINLGPVRDLEYRFDNDMRIHCSLTKYEEDPLSNRYTLIADCFWRRDDPDNQNGALPLTEIQAMQMAKRAEELHRQAINALTPTRGHG